MERHAVLQRLLTKEMRGIEIGALHAPIVPKKDGWSVVSVDHDTVEGLVKANPGASYVSLDSLQAVDVVWNSGTLRNALQKHDALADGFEYIVASHVVEHFPDLLGTLIDFESVLKDGGVLSFAVPDMRYCFDFFMPHTTTADVLQAHSEGRTRHTKASFFRMAAYSVNGIATGSESDEFVGAENISLAADVFHARDKHQGHDESSSSPYVDNHTWYFTPSSFSLIMLELRAIGAISSDIVFLETPKNGGEFFVSMRKSNSPFSGDHQELNARRLNLLKQTVHELAHRSVMLQFSEKRRDRAEKALLEAEIDRLRSTLHEVMTSTSWRISAPVRAVKRALAKVRRSIE